MNEYFLLQSGPGNFALNMAFDEGLLEAMPRLNRPILRFYGWTEPAASFGYFQKYAEVRQWTQLRPLVRRPTGGGIVPHDVDWTYSLAFPPSQEWYSLTAKESYHRAHAWIQAAFASLDVPVQLASVASRAQPGQCFVGYEQFDLLWRGKKIAGAAQRRRRDGLLIQGSVQPPPTTPSIQRETWEQAMVEVGRKRFGIDWLNFTADEELSNRVQKLRQEKYLLDSYNQRR